VNRNKIILLLSIITFIFINSCLGIPLSVFYTVEIVNNTGEDIRAAAMRFADGTGDAIYFFNRNDSVLANGDSRTFNLSRINISISQILTLVSVDGNYYDILVGVINSSIITPFTQSHLRATRQTQTTANAAEPSSAPSVPAIYRIGDTGPAGGIIFYDKGNNSSGWRYLEAALYETEVQIRWSVNHSDIENTLETIGSGRRNTQLIVEAFNRAIGEWDNAAQYCDDLVFGGYDDWFLPSKDELDQMYGNLKRRNLGDFRDNWYWSSTQSSFWQTNTQNFSNGSMSNATPKNERWYVRPIRQVAHP